MRSPIHICPLDSDCREHGAPPRIHINTPWGHFAVALRPSARFLRWCPENADDQFSEHWFVWDPNTSSSTPGGR